MDRRLERERGGCTVVGVSEMGRLGRWRGTVGGRDKYRWLMMEEWKIIRVVDGARELELGAGWHGWAGRGPWVQDPGGCWPDQSIVVNGSWLLRQCPGPPGQEFNPHRLQPAVAASLPPLHAASGPPCTASVMQAVLCFTAPEPGLFRPLQRHRWLTQLHLTLTRPTLIQPSMAVQRVVNTKPSSMQRPTPATK